MSAHESTETQETSLAEEIQVFEPAKSRLQVIGLGADARAYEQKPLGIVGKMRLFQVLADAFNQAYRDDGGRTIGALFGVDATQWDGESESINLGDLTGGVDFFAGLMKLAQYAPDLVLDVYCIALRVPTHEWAWTKEVMERPVDEGGLSDDDGIAILETFIDQNGEALKSFFVEKLMPLVAKIRGKGEQSASSKPSSPTPPTTQSPSVN